MECVLCDDILSQQIPGSLLAATALLLGLKWTRQIDQPQIAKRFFKHQPYKRDELETCSTQLVELMRKVPRSLYHTNVREKYKRTEFDRVATYRFSDDLGKIFRCSDDRCIVDFRRDWPFLTHRCTSTALEFIR